MIKPIGAFRPTTHRIWLPAPVCAVFESAYDDAIGHPFRLAAPFAPLTLLAVIAMREVPPRRTLELDASVGPVEPVETRGFMEPVPVVEAVGAARR